MGKKKKEGGRRKGPAHPKRGGKEIFRATREERKLSVKKRTGMAVRGSAGGERRETTKKKKGKKHLPLTLRGKEPRGKKRGLW